MAMRSRWLLPILNAVLNVANRPREKQDFTRLQSRISQHDRSIDPCRVVRFQECCIVQ